MLKYQAERLEGVSCLKANCNFFNLGFEQSCDGEYNGETAAVSCKEYEPGEATNETN